MLTATATLLPSFIRAWPGTGYVPCAGIDHGSSFAVLAGVRGPKVSFAFHPVQFFPCYYFCLLLSGSAAPSG